MQHKRCAAITAQLHRTATMFTGLLLRKGRVFSGHRTKDLRLVGSPEWKRFTG